MPDDPSNSSEGDFWDDLRLGWSEPPPALDASLAEWASELGTGDVPIVVLRGPTSQRAEAYGWFRQEGAASVVGRDGWLGVGAVADFTFHLSRLGGDWHLIWGLLDVQDLVIDEPLRELVDRGSRYTDLFKAIWEIRFLLDEGHDVRPHIDTLARWMSEGTLPEGPRRLPLRGSPTLAERADLLLFLLALSQQNNHGTPIVFIFDGLERAIQQAPEARKSLLTGLLTLIEAIERWADFGCPAGALIGMPDEKRVMSRLQRHNVRLYRKVRSYLPGV